MCLCNLISLINSIAKYFTEETIGGFPWGCAYHQNLRNVIVGPISSKLGENYSWEKGIQVCLNQEQCIPSVRKIIRILLKDGFAGAWLL